MKLIGMGFVLLFTACGPHQVDVSGTVTHKIEIDLVKLETYFEPSCKEEQPDNIQSCVSDKMGQFLQFVMSQ